MLFGVGARLIWNADIEYKLDENWTFEHVKTFMMTGQIPGIGMMSSARVPNPGMSIWVFLALGSLFNAGDPPALAQGVATLNVAAILLLTFFILRCVRAGQREPWLWAVALLAVNPSQILFHRKIWAQSVLPIVSLGLLIGWWYRRNFWGAFLWGLIGAVIGQIHLGGVFFAAAFVVATLIFDRRSVRWRAWMAGTLIGVLPAIPWVFAILADPTHAGKLGIRNLAFPVLWLNTISGFDAPLVLGRDFEGFLDFPGMNGMPVHLAPVLFCVIALALFVLVIRLTMSLGDTSRHAAAAFLQQAFRHRYGDRRGIRRLWFALLAVSLRPVFSHYLVIAFPLPFLSLTWLVLETGPRSARFMAATRALLLVLVLTEAGLTACLMSFIHDKQIIQGDYGTVYRAQTHQEK